MTRNLKWRILLVVFVVGLACWFAFPLQKKIKLGLDLKGGMHLVLKVDTSALPKEAQADARERALEIIRNRVDQFGVAEPSIQLQGRDRIIVQLPGVSDRQRALNLIGRTAMLEFKLVAEDKFTESVIEEINQVKDLSGKLEIRSSSTRDGVAFKDFRIPAANAAAVEEILADEKVKAKVPPEYELRLGRPIKNEEANREYRELFLLKKEAEIKGMSLTDARRDMGGIYSYVVRLEFDRQGARQMSRVTGRAEKRYHEDRVVNRLAIVLDNVVYSAPYMAVRVSSSPVIEGDFTLEEADDLAIILRAGALPAPIVIEEERTVGPSLGRDSVEAGVRAIITGTVLVVGFMGIYYLFSGLIADFALCINVIIILGVLAYFKSTLTLPGIAGILLTVGMAVDANVLIFERMREEMKTGKSIRPTISAGYNKAFLAIFDSNLTTLISAVILYWIGVGPIRGFALTLGIGLIASMFTALTVTRVIYDVLCLNRNFRRVRFLQVIGETHFDFMKHRRLVYGISAVVILIGMISFVTRGQKSLGIDFAGGTLQQFEFSKPVTLKTVRDCLVPLGMGGATIQQFGNDRELIVRTPVKETEKILGAFREAFPDNQARVVRVEEVGPAIGKELKIRAIWAIILSFVAICIYVSFRFEFKYAAAGVIALVHDSLVCIGFASLTGREMSMPVVAAVLTIIGFSINDTIVIFDRVREDKRLMPKTDLAQIINTAVNQTLSRTLLTTFTVLLSICALFFLGGEVINDFAFVFLVGVISGVYSTVFIAAPMVVDWPKRKR